MSKTKRSGQHQSDLCQRFEVALELLGLTPSSAFERLGYSTPSTLYSVVAGRCLPDMTRLVALSKLETSDGRRINVDWLVTGCGPKVIPTPRRSSAEIERLLTALSKEKFEALTRLLGEV